MSNTVKIDLPPSEPPKDPALETPPKEKNKEVLLAGRFKSQEELEKGYIELLKSTTSATKQTPDMKIPDKPKAIDFESYSKKIVEKGELEEADYKELEGRGIPKEVVDHYVNSLKQNQQKAEEKIFNIAGGEEEFSKMVDWASKSLSVDEINLFNSLVENKDPKIVELAVRDLHTKYREKVSSPPSKNLGGKASATGSGEGVYESHAQFMKDLKHPDYDKDPAFRAKVAEKLSRSKF